MIYFYKIIESKNKLAIIDIISYFITIIHHIFLGFKHFRIWLLLIHGFINMLQSIFYTFFHN